MLRDWEIFCNVIARSGVRVCSGDPMNSELTLVSLALFVSAWDLDLDGPRCPLGSSSLPCCSRDRSLCPGTERGKVFQIFKVEGSTAPRRPGDRYPGLAATHHHKFGPTLRGMTSPSLTQPATERGLPTRIGRRPLYQDRCSGGRGREGVCTCWFYVTDRRLRFVVHPVRGGGSTPPGRRAEPGHPSAHAALAASLHRIVGLEFL